MTKLDPMLRPAAGGLIWLSAALAGTFASGIGTVLVLITGGMVGMPGFLSGGVLAGAAIGLGRPLIASAMAAGAPLVLLGLIGLTTARSTFSAAFGLIFVASGVGEGLLVAAGAAIGLHLSRRGRLGALRSPRALVVVIVGGIVAVVGWLIVFGRLIIAGGT